MPVSRMSCCCYKTPTAFSPSRIRSLFSGLCLLLSSAAVSAIELSLRIADMAAPDFSAHGITLVLPQNGSADLRITELNVRQHNFRNAHIHCAAFSLSTTKVSCRGGNFAQLPAMALEFEYRFDIGSWQISAQLRNVSGKRLASFFPATLTMPNQGELNGLVQISGNASGMDRFNADMRVVGAGFSDASGLHAAEQLHGSVKLAATRKGVLWAWQSDIAWQSGEIFWQPFYLKGGHLFEAFGNFDGENLHVERAIVNVPEAGEIQFSAIWNAKQDALMECAVQGKNLALEKIFTDYVKPLLNKGTLAESNLYGYADVDWQYRSGATQSLKLALRDAGIADIERRFALLGVNSEIDWRADRQHTADISFAGGALLGVPLGAGRFAVQMHGMNFDVPQAILPVLDGKFELHDFRLHRENTVWHWQLGATLGEISMEQFSQAAGWPKMLGTLSGRIPKISYGGNEVLVEGALQFNVFDGTVLATQLKLIHPFGRAPRLLGNLNMRGLDLDLLTRTFSFGNMQGRIDVDVNNLELQDWQPARFDARVFSSAGSYPKKISQKAVQNITALGGDGASAAIQRSYLQFFENFFYDSIGWSCALRNGVCMMGGVNTGSANNENPGAYVIVKGGGIPAITVMGYNRNVGWNELLARLKRVTQGNVQAVIK